MRIRRPRRRVYISEPRPGLPRPVPGPAALSREARRALQRQGLLNPGWQARLAKAGEPLLDFVNRFYRVPGFGLVLRDMFAGPYRRAAALLLGKLANQLAAKEPGLEAQMGFERALSFSANGSPILVVDLFYRGVRYRPLPWTRLQPQGLGRQLLYDTSVFPSPDRVHWVFDRRRLNLDRRRLVEQARSNLSRANGRVKSIPQADQWIARLGDMVMVV